MEGEVSRKKSEVERKLFGVRIIPDKMKALKIHALNRDLPLSHVLEEAIDEFLKKHGTGQKKG